MKKYLFLVICFFLVSELSFAQYVLLYSDSQEELVIGEDDGIAASFILYFDGGNEYVAEINYSAWCDGRGYVSGEINLTNERSEATDRTTISESITNSTVNGSFYATVKGWGPDPNWDETVSCFGNVRLTYYNYGQATILFSYNAGGVVGI